MAVAGLLIWVSTLLVAVAALVAGIAFFGAHPVNVAALSGTGSVGASFQLTSSMLLERGALAAAYVALGYTALLALGTFFSTLTDTPAGAIGATIGVYIVSEIMDGITQFGTLRYGFPTHYLDAWRSMFTANSFSRDMIAGGVVQLCWASVFAVAATVSFRRKDIRS